MTADGWDARYASEELIWSAEPNCWLVETFAESKPGLALDLGAGEGRNALWLARRGWEVTAVDFSASRWCALPERSFPRPCGETHVPTIELAEGKPCGRRGTQQLLPPTKPF